ncbi:hypothetical protein GCM10009821_17960 [Aeromicrobium halocynthiae]|uniref:LytR/CpsA/Psr regulator C-terminal domain-containing protein n=1 Tax=Aeromicrobium halocynthiae TaxID=560557 RepID=A0ABN2VZM0_9ACTN
MVEHRRTVSRRGSVLPAWFFVVVAVVSLGGVAVAGAAAWDITRAGDEPASAAPSPDPVPTTGPEPTGTEPVEPEETEPTAEPEPTPSPSPTPSVSRSDVAVSVLNATRTPGLAAQVSGRVSAAGWTVAATGNWAGGAAQTAVHYPPGREAEARLLADDLGIPAVVPAVQGMNTERLTVLLLSLP